MKFFLVYFQPNVGRSRASNQNKGKTKLEWTTVKPKHLHSWELLLLILTLCLMQIITEPTKSLMQIINCCSWNTKTSRLFLAEPLRLMWNKTPEWTQTQVSTRTCWTDVCVQRLCGDKPGAPAFTASVSQCSQDVFSKETRRKLLL